jgi:hypothetical protein
MRVRELKEIVRYKNVDIIKDSRRDNKGLSWMSTREQQTRNGEFLRLSDLPGLNQEQI